MKEVYLDIMEKALSAYTPRRIRDYIDEVKRDGLTEHGFPRLGVNIGILIAYGRRTELLDIFTEIMDICCAEMPLRKAANDFSIREVCCCLMLLEEKQTVDKELINKWRTGLAAFDPWHFYDRVDDHSGKFISNWALFAAVSEYMRGVFCGINTTDFVEWQLPSQLKNLDENGMYQDACPGKNGNPMVYDLVPRFLFAFLLQAGYKGKYAKDIENVLDKTAELTLKMQSVTGEIPFGGRSNQFLNNEPMLSAYCEMEAARFYEKGDMKRAGEFKAAASLAAEATLRYLSLDPISHVKNRYDVASKIGCEPYGYFNKYMITVASNIYMGHLFGNDEIRPTTPPVFAQNYVLSTGRAFHKTFLTAGGYHLELDTDASLRYDASGVGRIHKKGCPSPLCLSVPFPTRPHYTLEEENPSAMSICSFAEKEGNILLGAEEYAKYTFIKSNADKNTASAEFTVALSEDMTVTENYTLSEKGVEISQKNADGIMLPVFHFDGASFTDIRAEENGITVEYGGCVCKYTFVGKPQEYGIYYNRNGRYKVFAVKTDKIHIEMGRSSEF